MSDLLERTPVTRPVTPPTEILIPEARRRFRRRLAVVAVVTLASAAVVAVLWSATSPASRPARAPSPPSRTSSSTGPLPPRCVTSQLRLAGTFLISPVTMSSPHGFEVVDTDQAACTLDGYPRVVITDAGTLMSFTINHDGQQLTQRAPRPVRLSPGAPAYFAITQVACEARATHTATAIAISVGPGAASSAVPTENPVLQTCAEGDSRLNGLTVTPFEASWRSTLSFFNP